MVDAATKNLLTPRFTVAEWDATFLEAQQYSTPAATPAAATLPPPHSPEADCERHVTAAAGNGSGLPVSRLNRQEWEGLVR